MKITDKQTRKCPLTTKLFSKKTNKTLLYKYSHKFSWKKKYLPKFNLFEFINGDFF